MKAWGIDYGTTTSLWKEYSSSQFVDRCYPLWSSVYWSAAKGLRFGNDAYCLQDGNGHYVRSPKRFLDSACSNGWPIDITVDEVVVKFFKHMFSQYRDCEQENVPYITLTVPNSFKEKQYMRMRNAVLEAAKHCNKFKFDQECFDIIPEPVAAALYYAHKRMSEGTMSNNCNIIVCDIGGGTTDVAVVQCQTKDNPNGQKDLSFNVLCTSPYGNGLGGDRFDSRLVGYLTDNGAKYKSTPKYVLSYLAKVLKGYLSEVASAEIPLINADWDVECANNRKPIKLSCTREKFVNIISPDLQELENILKGVSKEFVEKYPEEYNNESILLPVGGSSRIPRIKEMLLKIFTNATMVDSDDDFVTYNSVVCGAALYSDWRMREKCGQLNTTPYNRLTILNRTPHKYTVEYSNGEFCEIVPRNAPDGIYSAEFIPIKIEDDGTFCIGKFGVYQGESTLLTHSEGREIVFEKELTDKLYSHGRKQKNINILLSLEIKSSRLNSIKIVAKCCTQDSHDYVKCIDINQIRDEKL